MGILLHPQQTINNLFQTICIASALKFKVA